MTNIPSITTSEFFNGVVRSGNNAIVDLWVDWCRPCHALEPALEKLSEEYKDRVRFYRIDLAKNADIAMKLEVMSVPTLVFVRDGEIVEKVKGAVSEGKLRDKIEELFGEKEHIGV